MHARTQEVEQLRHDLRNAPYHVFGDHSKCNQAFCHVREREETEERNDEQVPTDTNPESTETLSTLQEQLDNNYYSTRARR